MQSARTDAGVHARMQVLGLRVPAETCLEELPLRLHPHLAPHVGIACAKPAAPKFNPAWQATGKEYRFRLSLPGTRVHPDEAWACSVTPERLADCVALWTGTRTFEAFQHPRGNRRPRTITSASLHEPLPGLLEIRVRGNAFARHQVRCLVGASVKVARGEASLESFQAALAGGGPVYAPAAPAGGLVLWEIFFPPSVDPFDERCRASVELPSRLPFAYQAP